MHWPQYSMLAVMALDQAMLVSSYRQGKVKISVLRASWILLALFNVLLLSGGFYSGGAI